MPEEVEVPSPAQDTEFSLSEYRAQREGKAPSATTPEVTEPVKSADGSEPPIVENSEVVEEAGKDDKPKGGFQRRIDKLTKEKAELERSVNERDGKLTELVSRLEALEKKNPEVRAEARADGDAKPKDTDFKEYHEYIEALSKWTYRQERKAETEASEKSRLETAKKETEATSKAQFDKHLNEVRALRDAHPEFEQSLNDLTVPQYIHNRLVRMDKGADVLMALAQDKEAQKRILDLNQKAVEEARGNLAAADFSEAYWEFGAFVRSLNQQKNSPKQERPVSQAPAPISPVRGGDAPSDPDTDKMSLAEYRKSRESGRR